MSAKGRVELPIISTPKIFTAVYPFHVVRYSNLIQSTRSLRTDLQLHISSLQLQSYSIFPFPLKGDFTVCLLTDIQQGRQDSNLRQLHPKCSILPTELLPYLKLWILVDSNHVNWIFSPAHIPYLPKIQKIGDAQSPIYFSFVARKSKSSKTSFLFVIYSIYIFF